MRKLAIVLSLSLLLGGVMAVPLFASKAGTLKHTRLLQNAKKKLMGVAGKSLPALMLAGALTALPVSAQEADPEPHAPQVFWNEINDDEPAWKRTPVYILADNGWERATFHFTYIGTADGDSLLVGRRRPYGTSVVEALGDSFMSLVGHQGLIVDESSITEVTYYPDELDGLLNVTVVAVEGVDLEEHGFEPAALGVYPYNEETALELFTYRFAAHPMLEEEDWANQFALPLRSRDCRSVPHANLGKVRLGLHTCGDDQEIAIGALVYNKATQALVGFQSGWSDNYYYALGIPEHLVQLGEWVAAAPAIRAQNKLTTTWAELKRDPLRALREAETEGRR